MIMSEYVEFSLTQVSNNASEMETLIEPVAEAIENSNCNRIILVASGSSYNASLSALTHWKKINKFRYKLETPASFEKRADELSNNDYILFISQSGESTNILQAMSLAKERQLEHLLLTDNLDSTGAKLADKACYWGSGRETVGYVTVGVHTLIQYLIFLGKHLVDQKSLEVKKENDIGINVDSYVSKVKEYVERNRLDLALDNITIFCGDQANFGVAKEASLKWEETLKRPAMYFELEEFLHGPDYQLTPNYTIFLLDDEQPDNRYFEVYEELKDFIPQLYFITKNPKAQGDKVLNIPDNVNPIYYQNLCLLPLQYIAATETDILNRWQKHPFIEEFNSIIGTKTQKYVNSHK